MSLALLVAWMWLHGQTVYGQRSYCTVNADATVFIGCTDEQIDHVLSKKMWTWGMEPQDVPAVQEDYVEHHAGESCVVGNNLNWCVYQQDVIGKRWTCANKSRILLTAEDGSRHCVKFAEGR